MPELNDALALKFVERIYETALDPSRWAAVLSELADLYDGKAVLFMQDLARGDSNLAEFSRFEPSFLESYVTYYGARSPWTDGLARLPAGTVVTEAMLAAPDVLERTEFYNDWLRPQGFYSAIGIILEKTGTVATNLAINRSARRGPITEQEASFLSVLAPHIRRAVRMHRQLTAARFERDVTLAALEDLAIGVIITDRDGRTIFINRGADRLLCSGSGLSVQQGRLVADTPAATSLLRATIRSSAGPLEGLLSAPGKRGAAAPHHGLVRLPLRDGGSLPILVGPLRGGYSAAPLGFADRPAILFVRAPKPDGYGTDERRLAKLYDLTPAEARLMGALLAGMEPKSYAKEIGVSLNTVKTQLKSLFTKTGQHRQAELIRHLLSDPLVRLG